MWLGQVVSTALMLTSSYFWIRGNLWMSLETMKQIGATAWDSNPAVVRNLISQRADSTVAFAFLVLGLLLSVWLPCISDRLLPSVRKTWLLGTVILVLAGFVFYLTGNCVSRTMEHVLAKRM